MIEDLRGRNGRGNLIEQVRVKVGNIDFAEGAEALQDKKIQFFDRANKPIVDAQGKIIIADAAIAATGFRPKLDQILDQYAKEITGSPDEILRAPITLPTNEKVVVAEKLRADGTVLILGTASATGFDSVDKLAQLPQEAREALLRNGAENAVAIGFRGPDDAAAMKIFFDSQEVMVDAPVQKIRRETITLGNMDDATPERIVLIKADTPNRSTKIPNNITNEARTLSPIFTQTIGNTIEVTTKEGKRFTGEIDFTVTFNPVDKSLGLFLNKDQGQPIPAALFDAVRKACMDDYFQKYATSILSKKRRNPTLNIVLSFKNGFVDPKSTFIQD